MAASGTGGDDNTGHATERKLSPPASIEHTRWHDSYNPAYGCRANPMEHDLCHGGQSCLCACPDVVPTAAAKSLSRRRMRRPNIGSPVAVRCTPHRVTGPVVDRIQVNLTPHACATPTRRTTAAVAMTTGFAR